MRGSVDAKYGIPLVPPGRRHSPPGHQRATPDHHRSPPPEYEPRRLGAPLFSPPPQLLTSVEIPTPMSDEASNVTSGNGLDTVVLPDSGWCKRVSSAPRDVYTHTHLTRTASAEASLPRPGRVTGGSAHMLSQALPKDVVTCMALALGAPTRPARAGPANGAARRPATMSEVFVSAPVSGTVRSSDSVQTYGRMCDLLFFGDELPIPVAMVEILPAAASENSRADAYPGAGAVSRERMLSCLFSVFSANDQMHRLLRACAQQQINQTASRKEILRDDCASKSIIVQYVGLCAGDYLQRLLAPTIRALQGPWTANEAGLKGALDRLLTRLSSLDAPADMRVVLKTVYACIAKKYGRRAISTLMYMLMGDLFEYEICAINASQKNVKAMTSEGARFLDSMARVLAQLSLNESFAGGSNLYHMNSWIQSRYESFEKSMDRILAVDEPAIVPWNSGCTVKGSVQNLQVLMRALTKHKEDIHHFCMSLEWLTPATQSFYHSRFPILWAALESGRRRGNSEHFTSPPRSARGNGFFLGVSPEREKDRRLQAADASSMQARLLGQMVNMVSQHSPTSEDTGAGSGAKCDSSANRMQHLSATVTDMDLDGRDLVAVPQLHHFKNLHTLNIPRNRIRELGDLPASLRALDCSRNQLVDLSGVECLFHLEHLNASHNVLQHVVGGLINSHQMISLDLSYNRLDAVLDFAHMVGLRSVHLNHNEIMSVQDARLLALNPNLAALTLNDNPLCEEGGYLRQIALMLPQLEIINSTSLASPLFLLAEATKSPIVHGTPSPHQKPALSPFVAPATPSPRLKLPTSPFLMPGSAELARVASSPLVSPILKHEHAPSSVPRNDHHNFTHLRASAHLLSMSQTESGENIVFPRSGSPLIVNQSLRLVQSDDDLEEALWQASYDASRNFWDQSTSNTHQHGNVYAPMDDVAAAVSLGRKSSAMEMLAQVAMAEVNLTDIVGAIEPAALQTSRRNTSLSGTGRVANPVTPSVAMRKTASTPRGISPRSPRSRKLAPFAAHDGDDDDRPQPYDTRYSKTSHSRSRSRDAAAARGQMLKDESVHTSTKRKPHALESRGRDSQAPPSERRPRPTTRIAASRKADTKSPRDKKQLPATDSREKRDTRETADMAEMRHVREIHDTRDSRHAREMRDKGVMSVASGSLIQSVSPLDLLGKAAADGRKTPYNYTQGDLAEMVMEVNNDLKTMSLVFRGWKFVHTLKCLASHLAHPDCRLVLTTQGHYMKLTLRPVFEAWALVQERCNHMHRCVDKRRRTSKSRILIQLLHEWSAISHSHKRFQVRMTRRLCLAARMLMKNWRDIAVTAMGKKVVGYRVCRHRDKSVITHHLQAWNEKIRETTRHMIVRRKILRRRLTRLVGAAFDALCALLARACRIESDLHVAATRTQQDCVGAVLLAWHNSMYCSVYVARVVRNMCGKMHRVFVIVKLRAFFDAWYRKCARKMRLCGISGRLLNHAERKRARQTLACLVRNRALHLYHKDVVAKIERLRSAAVLRVWRQAMCGTQALNWRVSLCARRRCIATQRGYMHLWIEVCEKHRRQSCIEDTYEAMLDQNTMRYQARVLHEWLDHQTVKREYSLISLRALHKRRRQHLHLALTRLRAKARVGKARASLDDILVRKERRRFVRVFFENWIRAKRQSATLHRRLPTLVARRVDCETRRVFLTWHEVAHRRFQVAAMLDKILLKRKAKKMGSMESSPGSPDAHLAARPVGPRLNLARHLDTRLQHTAIHCNTLQHFDTSPRQPSTSPRRSESGH